MKITLDTEMYFNIAQVGSSIHGNLLKPNDIDIAICFKLPLLNFQKVKCFRLGKFNLILIHGKRLKDYVNEFDFNVLRGYKTLFTRKLILFYPAKIAFECKWLCQLERDCSLFEDYEGKKQIEKDRAEHYQAKIPKGWAYQPLIRRVDNI